ncbi:MAG: hypothetical protein LBJ63_11155 [Prevotellaceae bacterium]|jgi:ribosomal 50S subunit-associated protein YjgA (DUF615 family)|nr:hypothetical protein [Prevotellaceae bacterium]
MNEVLVENLRADLQEALIQAAKVEDDIIRRQLVDFIEKWLRLTKQLTINN